MSFFLALFFIIAFHYFSPYLALAFELFLHLEEKSFWQLFSTNTCNVKSNEYYPSHHVWFIARGRSSVVEHLVANENVVSSNLIARSIIFYLTEYFM